jgi:hypothetical protein
MEGDRALWRLSRIARSTPTVCEILSENTADDMIPSLEKSAASQQFLADFRKWLAYYGQRLNSAFELDRRSNVRHSKFAGICRDAGSST